jgi:tetratricopeptide (TPR) repeat protein
LNTNWNENMQKSKKNSLILALFLLLSAGVSAQNTATNQEMQTWFDANEHEKILNIGESEAGSLLDTAVFWTARVYLRAYRDADALAYFDKILARNAKYADAHFYRGVALVGLNQLPQAAQAVDAALGLEKKKALFFALRADIYKAQNLADSAIIFYEKAIALPDCPMPAFENCANIYNDRKLYKKALTIQYKQKNTAEKSAILGKNLLSADDMDYLLYAIALNEYNTKQYKAAEKTLLQLLETKPNNYQIVSKLVQTYFAMQDTKRAQPLQARIMTAYAERKLPKTMVDSYCFEQFEVKKIPVHAHQNFVADSSKIHAVYSFHVLDAQGEVEYYLHLEQNESAKKLKKRYIFTKSYAKKDAVYLYAQFAYDEVPTYANLRQIAIKIISDKAKHSHERYIYE